jgi:hypothetical protein
MPMISRRAGFAFPPQPTVPEGHSTTSEALAIVNGAGPASGMGVEEEEEEDEQPSGAYNPLTLFTAERKRDQIVILRQQILTLKLAFNAQFDDLCRCAYDPPPPLLPPFSIQPYLNDVYSYACS